MDSVGKIKDLFAGKGITESFATSGNAQGMEITSKIAKMNFNGLCFVNLVDFDMLYGHRQDVDGYANALTAFDKWLGEFLPQLLDDDLLIITADHGCDPSDNSTDHTREYIPLIAYGKQVLPVNLGIRTTFADIAATVVEALGTEYSCAGKSMFGELTDLRCFLKERAKEIRVLDISEQKKLEAFLIGEMNLYKFAVLLALYTGVRIGELCALDWGDITDEIKISKTLYRIKQGNRTVLEIAEPKTPSSNRVIPVPECIRGYVEWFRDYGSVLKNRNGNRVEPRLMQMTFEKFVAECGLPKTNFHALRHTFATRCVEAGFDIKSLSEILGHSDVKTTLNVTAQQSPLCSSTDKHEIM